MTKSSQKSRLQVLGVISAERAERLLTEWVNVQPLGGGDRRAGFEGDGDEFRRLLHHYPEVFPGDPGDLNTQRLNATTARMVHPFLRKAWDASDLRHCEWYLARAEHYFRGGSIQAQITLGNLPLGDADIFEQADEPTLTPTPFEAAIFYLRRNVDRALHCPNENCHTPYFFASKKGQKYCSEPCAIPSQRAAKRRWWSEHKAKGGK